MLVIVEQHDPSNFGGYCIESSPKDGVYYVPFAQKLHFITDYRMFNDLLINNDFEKISYCTNTYNTGDEWAYRANNERFFRIPYLKELLESLKNLVTINPDLDTSLPPFDNNESKKRIIIVDDDGKIHLIYSDMYYDEYFIPRNSLYKYFIEVLFDVLNRFDTKHEINLFYSRLKTTKKIHRENSINESRHSFNDKDILQYRKIVNKFGITSMDNCTP